MSLNSRRASNKKEKKHTRETRMFSGLMSRWQMLGLDTSLANYMKYTMRNTRETRMFSGLMSRWQMPRELLLVGGFSCWSVFVNTKNPHFSCWLVVGCRGARNQRDEDVLGLDISMADAARVEVRDACDRVVSQIQYQSQGFPKVNPPTNPST